MSPIYNGGKGTLKEDAKITIIGAKTAKPTLNKRIKKIKKAAGQER